jgi:hypothetical protein
MNQRLECGRRRRCIHPPPPLSTVGHLQHNNDVCPTLATDIREDITFQHEDIQSCERWGPHSRVAKIPTLLGCDAVSLVV